MSVDMLINMWKEFRKGLIAEVEQIPEDKFDFRATAETRTIAEVLQHIVEIQKMLIGEASRPDGSLRRQSFADHIKEYAPDVASVNDKHGLLELLRTSMEVCEASIRSNEDLMTGSIGGMDGKPAPKLRVVNFAMSHEMYHRGQLTVYERLLNLEPALTKQFARMTAQANNA
jgi:uncharacterized damage-inducible protein DinB